MLYLSDFRFSSSIGCLIVVYKLLKFLVLLPDDVPLRFVKTDYCHPQKSCSFTSIIIHNLLDACSYKSAILSNPGRCFVTLFFTLYSLSGNESKQRPWPGSLLCSAVRQHPASGFRGKEVVV